MRSSAQLELAKSSPLGRVLSDTKGVTLTGADGGKVQFTVNGRSYEAALEGRTTVTVTPLKGSTQGEGFALSEELSTRAEALHRFTPEAVAEANASPLGKRVAAANLKVLGHDRSGVHFSSPAHSGKTFVASDSSMTKGLTGVAGTGAESASLARAINLAAVKQSAALKAQLIQTLVTRSGSGPVLPTFEALGYSIVKRDPVMVFKHGNGSEISMAHNARKLSADEAKAFALALETAKPFVVPE